MNVIFTPDAWDDFQYWMAADKAVSKKITELIKDIQRNGFMTGIGKPESLKGRKEFSRRITQEHRLVYSGDDQQNLIILSCIGHYRD